MIIVVDEREHDLYSTLIELSKEMQHITIQKEVLHLGDILIKGGEGETTHLLIERKTFSDLLSSIKDGRYEEQSYRLIHSSGIPLHNIIYVLEGMFYKIAEKDRKIIYSSLTSLNFFKGFSIFRTCNINETADWILMTADKIQRELKKGKLPHSHSLSTAADTSSSSSSPPPPPAAADYCNVVKKAKKENITPENISEIILCQIPGISSATAMAITQKFHSFTEFMKEIETNPQFLENIYIETNGKTRKINKNCIENIKKYLFTPAIPLIQPPSLSSPPLPPPTET